MSNMNQRMRYLILMGFLVIAVNAVGTYGAVRWETNAPLGLAVGATAVIVFVGMLALSQAPSGPWRISAESMRLAIASSILAQYQALIAIVAFVSRGSDTSLPISQTLMANFTSIVGVVIAFYFGASAYVDGRRIREERQTEAIKPVEASL